MIHRMWVLKLFVFSDKIMEQKVGQAPNVSSTFLGKKITRISLRSRMDQETQINRNVEREIAKWIDKGSF